MPVDPGSRVAGVAVRPDVNDVVPPVRRGAVGKRGYAQAIGVLVNLQGLRLTGGYARARASAPLTRSGLSHTDNQNSDDKCR